MRVRIPRDASLALILLFWLWQSLPQMVSSVGNEAMRWILSGLSMAGWLLVLTGTFMINHFELFGLQQVWRYGRADSADGGIPPFVTRA